MQWALAAKARAFPGATGGPGTNPEQLLALGYAACFQSAGLRFATVRGLDLRDSRVTARVGIGLVPRAASASWPHSTSMARRISRAVAADLMSWAHETCPYSRAVRDNVEVTLTVGGAIIERAAA